MLYNWQKEAVQRLETQDGLCLWADTGLGKGYLASTILGAGDLVLCPSHLVGDWVEKLQEQGKELNPIIKKFHTWDKNKVNIISIQKFRLNPEPFLGFKIGLLVIDEAHRIKNYKGKGYKAVLKLLKYSSKVLCISATFLTKNNVDMFAPAFLSSSSFRKEFDWSFWKFAKENVLFQSRYFGSRTVQEPIKITETAMKKYVNPMFWRVTYATAGVPEPERILKKILIPANRKVEKRIESIKEIGNFWELTEQELELAIRTQKAWIVKAQQLVNQLEYKEESVTYYNIKEKIETLKSIIETETGKGIVFYRYKAELEILQKELKAPQMQWKNFSSIQEFETSSCSVLLCQQKAVGEGIRFKNCNYIVEFSLGFDFADIEQGRGRLRYAGRKDPYKIYTLVLDNSFAKYILENINKKSNLALEHGKEVM